jgi:hypothetical protein
MFERPLNRATDVATEVVNSTAVHLQRVVSHLCAALGRTAHELTDMIWDYQDLASDLRRSELRDDHRANAVVIDLRRRLG